MSDFVKFSTDNIFDVVSFFINIKQDSILGAGNHSVAIDNYDNTVSIYSLCPSKFYIYDDTEFLEVVNKASQFFTIPSVVSIENIAKVEIINDQDFEDYKIYKECYRLKNHGFMLQKYIMPKYKKLELHKLNNDLKDIFQSVIYAINKSMYKSGFAEDELSINNEPIKAELIDFFKIIDKKISRNDDISYDGYTQDNFLIDTDGRIVLLDLFLSSRLSLCLQKV